MTEEFRRDDSDEIALLKHIASTTDRIERKTDGLATELGVVHQRIDQVEARIESGERRAIVVSAATGGLAGGAVAVAMEMIRLKLGL